MSRKIPFHAEYSWMNNNLLLLIDDAAVTANKLCCYNVHPAASHPPIPALHLAPLMRLVEQQITRKSVAWLFMYLRMRKSLSVRSKSFGWGFAADSNPSLSATQSGLQRNRAAFPLEVARKRRNFAVLALKPDWRKCRAEPRMRGFRPFSLEGRYAVRFRQTHLANANVIINRSFGERETMGMTSQVRELCFVNMTLGKPMIAHSAVCKLVFTAKPKGDEKSDALALQMRADIDTHNRHEDASQAALCGS
jgi:hypothetical protein